MGVVNRCMWVESMGVVVRRYINFQILFIHTPHVSDSVIFCSCIPTFCSFIFKTLCAAFIWLPWDARSHPYVCLYCVKKLFNT